MKENPGRLAGFANLWFRPRRQQLVASLVALVVFLSWQRMTKYRFPCSASKAFSANGHSGEKTKCKELCQGTILHQLCMSRWQTQSFHGRFPFGLCQHKHAVTVGFKRHWWNPLSETHGAIYREITTVTRPNKVPTRSEKVPAFFTIPWARALRKSWSPMCVLLCISRVYIAVSFSHEAGRSALNVGIMPRFQPHDPM